MLNKFILAFSFLTYTLYAAAQHRLRIEIIGSPPTHRHDTVYLAGSMNGWNPGLQGYALYGDSAIRWYELTNLPAAIYEFKFTRGNWQKAETDKKGRAIDNRIVELKSDTVLQLHIEGWADDFPTRPPVSTRSRNVFIVDSAFRIPQLNRTRRVWIYLPADYALSRRTYPVLYMHDGQNLFDERSSGYGEWGVDELIDSIPKAQCRIIVGIEHGGESRLTEYNPYDSRFGKGEGDAYLDFVVHQLKPFIDSLYRTRPDRRHTAIAGSSMGGLISFYAALKYPEVFGAAGVFSPAFWIAPGLTAAVDSLAAKTQTAIYFVAGAKESSTMESEMRKMHDAMQLKSKSKLKFITVPDGRHNEAFWRSLMPDFVRWLSALK